MILLNKTVFITGASSGLGRELAIQLSNQGANLVLFARNFIALSETARLCLGKPLLVEGDLTSENDCFSGVNRAIQQFGRIDYLILNAGISMWSSFDKLPDLSAIYQLMETNYFGAVRCTYRALPHLKKTKGMIVVISSIQGKISTPYHCGYAASKHALEGFFNSIRIELKKSGVKILNVCPSWIKNTELKKNAFYFNSAMHSQIKTKHTRRALALQPCAKQIIHAMINRKSELILPKRYHLLLWLKLFSPKILNFLISKAV